LAVWLLLAFFAFALVRAAAPTGHASARRAAAPAPVARESAEDSAQARLAARLSAAELELEQTRKALAAAESARRSLAAELEAARAPGATAGPAAGSAADRSAVVSAIEAWARAWSAQRVDDYLSAYSATYRPPGSNHAAWIDLRRRRLLAPSRIEVVLSEIKVAVENERRARAQFRQRYAADSYSDIVVKQLTLDRRGDRWEIAEERVLEP
jgi:hypothetical protein